MNFASRLLALFAPALHVVPGGPVLDGRVRYWPPHRPIPTQPKHRLNPGFRNDDEGRRVRAGRKPDRLRMAVVHGRVTIQDRAKLVGGKGLCP